MDQPIIYIDTSDIRKEKIKELEDAIPKLVSFVEKNVPQLISYKFFLNEERSQMTVFAIHPGSASLKHHMDVGKNEFRKFSELIELKKIKVYGDVSDEIRQRLHKKVQMLGSGTVGIHSFYDGFKRWNQSTD